jgi:predicted phosphodiesterase
MFLAIACYCPMRIAILSDMHGARRPFERALADARASGFDQLVLLGDLFTYGVEPETCRDLALDAITQGALLIGGNHDQLYVDLAAGDSGYLDGRPAWLVESVLWTWERLGRQWPEQLAWQHERIIDDVLLAHANPYGTGDWRYLNSPDALEAAAACLADRRLRAGVFGHVHRPAAHTAHGVEVFVVGSLGQPRSRDRIVPEWSLLELRAGAITIERCAVEFDAAVHCADIQATDTLSPDTRNRLCRFFQ